MSEKSFIEVTIDVPRKFSDAVCNFIIENISSGLILEEEEDAPDITIKFYTPKNDDNNYREKLRFYLNSLSEMYPKAELDLDFKERTLENVEWEEAYKESLKPVFIGEDVAVRPPWEEAPSHINYDIIIEPKMAFGTGTHETTRSCLLALREHFKAGWSMLDVGCGSGVLSILAAKIGAKSLKALDYDPISVENTLENFQINRVKCPYDVQLGSIEVCLNDKPFDLVCANIIKVTILEMISELLRLTKKNGILILSGLLDIDVDDIKMKLEEFGITKFKLIEDNEWRTLIIKKP